jgi:hypothetical protein
MALDLLELEHELARERAALDSWAQEQEQDVGDRRDAYRHFLQDQHGLWR